MAARIGKLCAWTLLAGLCLSNNSCSSTRSKPRTALTRKVDVSGCGPLKWGMTLDQAKMLLGPQAHIDEDLATGSKTEDVTMRIWDTELSGFASTESHTGRINAVHFLYQDGHPIKVQMFNTLKQRVTEDYGAPSLEYPLQGGMICLWTFPSADIMLTSHGNATVSLAYMQHTSGIHRQTPLQN
jgi:hypothetical protein